MPDFFLISGLFLSRTIHGPLQSYIDRKVIHFAYFYLLWLTIQQTLLSHEILLAEPGEFARRWLVALVEPIGTLWFVHMLAVFYVVTRLVKDMPKWLVLLTAAGLQTAYQAGFIDTGWSVVDRFADRYVYFFLGYAAAPFIFDLAGALGRRPVWALLWLPAWGLANWAMAQAELHHQPGTSLVMGLAGALAICAVSAVLAERGALKALGYAGANSIVIYLTFFLPMEVMEKIFLAVGPPLGSVGLACLVILTAAVVGPLIFHRVIRQTPLNFLYVRPKALRFPGSAAGAQPASSGAASA